MIRYSKLKSRLNEQQNIFDRFVVGECLVVITKDLHIIIDEELVGCSNSLEEARLYACKYVTNKKIVEQINTVIPEEKLVALIQKHHNITKITDSLIESYIELASSNTFSIDPVITEIKHNAIEGKFQYVLDDGSVVAIGENTQVKLSNHFKDKYQIVEHMRKSKDNFMNAIRELKE
jgi:hypothetical protein